MTAGSALFITFEGIEGSGKTTQIRRLREHFEALGKPVLATREPGGTPLADRVRELILANRTEKVSPRAELFLYLASRAQHVHSVIKPALRQGITVICDRFTDATLAYQGYGRGLDLAFLEGLNRYATEGIVPDLTFLLDVPAREGLERVRKSRGTLDRLESESLEFHEKVRRGYLELAAREQERIVVLDGRMGEDEIFSRIVSVVEGKLGR
ncbi:MAG: dTMP kinase [Deltaproteobacteria bacterium]|nr:MAG: dTMP kinase [Deltaproteobacteria bacterium]